MSLREQGLQQDYGIYGYGWQMYGDQHDLPHKSTLPAHYLATIEEFGQALGYLRKQKYPGYVLDTGWMSCPVCARAHARVNVCECLKAPGAAFICTPMVTCLGFTCAACFTIR